MGGGPGSLRRHLLNGQPIPATGIQMLAPGDRLTIIEAGGGGMGDPRQRSREAIRRDVMLGFVSEDHARQVYGLEDR